MSVVFDRAASFYDQTRGLPPQIEQDLAQLLREHSPLQQGSRVLEIGIGTGRIALPLARENGYGYTGIDLSRNMMRALDRKAQSLPIRLTLGNIAELPFADRTFDAVVAVHIFHLVDLWQQSMDEVQRVLRDGGVLLSGYNHRLSGSQARALRQKLEEFAGTRRERQAVGLLDHADVRPQLEWRFGPPEEYRTEPWQTTRTARQIIDEFGARTWSGTWLLSEEKLTHAVERGRQWALERYGTLDEQLVDEQQFVWEIYTRREDR